MEAERCSARLTHGIKMRKAKPSKNDSIPVNRKVPTHFQWQTLLRGELLALAVIVGAAWLVAGWMMGRWLPLTAPSEVSDTSWPTTMDTPERVSQRVLESLPRPVQQQLHDWNSLIAANFAGDQACAECHQSEYEAHQRSGHSHTAMMMSESPLAVELTERESYQDSRRDHVFEFTLTNRQLLVRDEEREDVLLPVTWLLGSGSHAQTPIAVDEATQRGVELRWSYFPDDERVGVTPDHDRYDEFAKGTLECFGRPMDDADIRACLGCHSTVMPPPNLPIINSMIVANVGCERCHGPRKKHAELAHLGRAEEVKPMLRYETAADYMATCAACHRDASSITPDMTPEEVARFQPYGLQRSRCYLETPGNMTCSTCHDPHDAVSHDRARSIDQCNECHENGSLSKCSHQPGGDCIECHMSLVPWKSGLAFHDHWIRVQGDDPSRDHDSRQLMSNSDDEQRRSE